MKKICILMVVLLIIASGCSHSSEDETVLTKEITVGHEEMVLGIGEHAQLFYTTQPEIIHDKNIIWYVEDPKVASVDDDGKVTPLKKGTTMICVEDTVTGLKSCMTLDVIDIHHPIVEDFFSLTWEDFSKKYEVEDFFDQGIMYEMGMDNTLKTLSFDTRFKEEIINGIKTGSQTAKVLDQLGEPIFLDESIHLWGYHFLEFDLFIWGKEVVEEIMLIERPILPEGYGDMIHDFIENYFLSQGSDPWAALDAFAQAYDQYMHFGHIHGGGQYIEYPFGIVFTFFDEMDIKVYGDFMGDVPEYELDDLTLYVYENQDSVFDRIRSYYQNKRLIDQTLEHKGVISPDGEIFLPTKLLMPNPLTYGNTLLSEVTL